MSRYYSVEKKAVLFMDMMLPVEAFMGTGHSAEMKLVSQIFDFVRSLAELELSETALALYSAYILLQHGKFDLYKIIFRIIFWLSLLVSNGNAKRSYERTRKANQIL